MTTEPTNMDVPQVSQTVGMGAAMGAGPSSVVAQVPSRVMRQHVANVLVNHGKKSKKFNGLNFKRWQQKMLVYLTTLNLARFLTETAPILNEGEGDIQMISVVDAWKHSDFLNRNYILNSLADSLYIVYSSMKTAKELWESLDRKYKTEDAGAKKFIVGRFLDYKMVDSKPVISQVQELQVILHEIHAEGMVVSETFQGQQLLRNCLLRGKTSRTI